MSKMDRRRVESYLNDIEKGDAIAIIWTIGDVRSVEPYATTDELTDAECRTVLRRLHDQHDAMYGISWVDVEDCASRVVKERS